MPNTELGQDPQAKSRPCERHKSQFIFEYICIKLVTQVKKTKKIKFRLFTRKFLVFIF